LRIRKVEAVPLIASFAQHYGGLDRVPAHILRPASHFQAIPRTGQYTTLVRIESDDGLIGYGEAFGLPHPFAASALISEVIGPALVGAKLSSPATMLTVLYRYLRALGQVRGVAAEAMSGIDIALWDLAAKSQGLPLCELLGGRSRQIPVYVSPVAFMATTEETAEASLKFCASGFQAIKIKIGRGIETDLAHVGAARSAVGADVQLMLDANCGYDTTTAIALAQRLKPLGIAWLEEPIPPGDDEAMARVRSGSPIPIAAGENCFELAEFEGLARSGAVDILQPNITRAGGITGMMAIDALCVKHGVSLAPHGVGGGVGVAAALHAASACQTVTTYEANRLPNALRDELPCIQPSFADSSLSPPIGSGHGGDPQLELLGRYSSSRKVEH
jgi:D-galactarolactone cycloisomerase